MFTKKLFVCLAVLLFIFQLSFVNALTDNETCLINEMEVIEHQELGINESDNSESNFKTDHDDKSSYIENKMKFNQGDKIPLHINSPVEGDLKVLIDDKDYGLWHFKQDETILIPTYNPESFYDDTKTNIDVGLHDISLIFNFKDSNYYDAEVSFHEDSTLNFYINTDGDVLREDYHYNHTLNILKKEKTIDIYYLDKFSFYEPNHFDIYINGRNLYEFEKNDNDPYGMIISDGTKILYKGDGSDEFSFPILNTQELFDLYEFNIGIYNLTVINLLDGTSDSTIFEIYKYSPIFNMTYLINESDITFRLGGLWNYENNVVITVDNMTKEILYDCMDIFVTFENLTPGSHVMRMYCPENKYSYGYAYNTTFEIKSNSPLINESDYTYINQSNIDNSSDIANSTYNNFSNIGNNNNTGNSLNSNKKNNNIQNDKKTNSKSKKNIKTRIEDNPIITVGEENMLSDSSDDSSTNKVYDISQKSVAKSIDNPLTELGLIILLLISFIVGYYRFGEKNY